MFNFLKPKISEGVKQISEQMINNPHDWVQDIYHFRNRTNPDIEIWTANGAGHINFNGNSGLNWAEKRYLNEAIKKSIANKLTTQPNKTNQKS